MTLTLIKIKATGVFCHLFFFFFIIIIFKYYYIKINKKLLYIFTVQIAILLYYIFVLINTIINKLFAVAILYFRVKQCVNYHYYTHFSTPLLYCVLFYT